MIIVDSFEDIFNKQLFLLSKLNHINECFYFFVFIS